LTPAPGSVIYTGPIEPNLRVVRDVDLRPGRLPRWRM